MHAALVPTVMASAENVQRSVDQKQLDQSYGTQNASYRIDMVVPRADDTPGKFRKSTVECKHLCIPPNAM